MIDSRYRNFFQKLFIDPIVPLLTKNRVHPSTLTLFALIFGITVTPFLAFDYNNLALISLLLSGYLDTIDGSVARSRGISTQHGAVYDIVCDRIVEFCIVFGLFFVSPETRGVWCLLMLGSILACVTSFLVVGIFVENDGEKSFHYSPGIIERAEAFIFFSLMILFPSMFSLLAFIFTLLVSITAIVRVCEFASRHSQNTNY